MHWPGLLCRGRSHGLFEVATFWFTYCTNYTGACTIRIFLLKIILKYLKEWGSYIIEGILYWLSRFIKSSFAWALTLKRYCRLQLAGENKYLYVPSRGDIKLDIDHVFVNLTLEYIGVQKSTYNHTDILSIGNRIRVVGDPGSGKSSLIKKIFRDACRNAMGNPSKSSLPLLVELKNLAIPSKIKS
jgi:hypothetical protein